MTRRFIFLSIILGGAIASSTVTYLKAKNNDSLVIEVVNQSTDPIEDVRLHGLNIPGSLGIISSGAVKRLTFDVSDMNDPLFLSFESADQAQRSTGIILHPDRLTGGQLVRLHVDADHSVTERRDPL